MSLGESDNRRHTPGIIIDAIPSAGRHGIVHVPADVVGVRSYDIHIGVARIDHRRTYAFGAKAGIPDKLEGLPRYGPHDADDMLKGSDPLGCMPTGRPDVPIPIELPADAQIGSREAGGDQGLGDLSVVRVVLP